MYRLEPGLFNRQSPCVSGPAGSGDEGSFARKPRPGRKRVRPRIVIHNSLVVIVRGSDLFSDLERMPSNGSGFAECP